MATASRNYKLRLQGIASPAGQIPLRDLAEIGQALQMTATRIARQVVGAERPGRAPAFIDRVSEIRLTGLTEGSTVLELTLGDETALPLADSEEDTIARRLEECFGAIAANRPPNWASPLVRESIGRLISRAEAAGASEVTASWGANGTTAQQVIALGQVDVTVWKVVDEQETEVVTMSGLLDKVDLRARRFRIHDDVGHDITLEDVIDLDTAARLIGRRVIARGVAERAGDKVARIVEPTLTLEALPGQWTVPPPAEVPAGGVVPRGGISGVTSEEVDDFLAELRV